MSSEAETPRAWTAKEEEYLENERKRSMPTPYKELAKLMDRSNQALRLKMYHLNRRRERAERQKQLEEDVKKYGGEVEQLKPRRRIRTKRKSPVKSSAEPRILLPADEKSPSPRKECKYDAQDYKVAGDLMALSQSKWPERIDSGLPMGSTQTPAITPPEPIAGSSQLQVAQGTYGQQTQLPTVYPTSNYQQAGCQWGTQGSSLQGPAFPQQLAPYIPPMQQPVVRQQPSTQQYAPIANMGYGYPSNPAAGPSTQHHTYTCANPSQSTGVTGTWRSSGR